jgi:hypothetical protein
LEKYYIAYEVSELFAFGSEQFAFECEHLAFGNSWKEMHAPHAFGRTFSENDIAEQPYLM